ncbi:MAG TPA: trypsin-like peptidase domain-containing protein [Candidatus Saccharimonadales bacterium]|nr:trypsin-like peptidase domain-containing protein [Candidatus Saccharimonadales bacterium]
MEESKEDKNSRSYSVSSRRPSKNSQGINITFTVPSFNVKRPELNRMRNPRAWGARTLVIVYVLMALIFGYAGAWLENQNGGTGGVTFATLNGQKKIVTSQSQLINQIAKSVGPSVVSVNVNITSSTSVGGFGLFGFVQPEQEQAAGTGIILSSDGLIVTNRHVVPVGTTSVSITLSNGTELKDVSVLGRTSSNSSLDIAFLKINNLEGQKLTPAVIGDSSQVQIGDSVVAIGNALGQFQNTVTSGIISGYGRSVQASSSTGSSSEDLADLFQTDAAINEGNSGGPLVNMNGEVIGINVATASGAQNIGFSIPINDVKGLISQVAKTGKFSVPYLGVRYIPLTADVANEYNLNVDNGAFIAPSSDPTQPSIEPGSPADNAGLQVNDIITAVNGTAIDQDHSLTSLLDQYTPGTKVSLSVIRGNKTITIDATLGSEPSN